MKSQFYFSCVQLTVLTLCAGIWAFVCIERPTALLKARLDIVPGFYVVSLLS
jgi:hypothetical protein